jgi:hypothetical protein
MCAKKEPGTILFILFIILGVISIIGEIISHNESGYTGPIEVTQEDYNRPKDEKALMYGDSLIVWKNSDIISDNVYNTFEYIAGKYKGSKESVYFRVVETKKNILFDYGDTAMLLDIINKDGNTFTVRGEGGFINKIRKLDHGWILRDEAIIK